MGSIIFGGVFDPIHLGHLSIIRYCDGHKLCNELIIIPSGTPPHKTGAITSPKHRLKMCELGLQSIRDQVDIKVTINPMETQKQHSGYTIDTLNALIDQGKKIQGVLIGSDQFFKFHTWKQYSEILQETKLYIMRRTLYTQKEADTYTKEVLKVPKNKIQHLNNPLWPISSTEIRESFGDITCPTEALPYGMMTYIQTHQLYTSQKERQ